MKKIKLMSRMIIGMIYEHIYEIVSVALAIVIGFIIGIAIPTDRGESVEVLEETETEETEEIEVPAYGADYFVHVAEMGTWEVPSDFEPIDCSLDADVQEFAYYMAEANNIDFTFLMAVMYCESGFDSTVVSASNDYGLMQINEINHEWMSEELGITDFLDPYQNIIAGVFVFRNLFEKYDDPSMVLMAYNMGEGGASRLWNQGIYSTKYSEKVMNQMQEMGVEENEGERISSSGQED